MTSLLNLMIGDIMTCTVCHVAPDCTVAEAARRMNEAHISSMLVMKDDLPLGIVTERDLLRMLGTHADREVPVCQIMSSPVLTMPSDTDFETAYATALNHHVRHLVVVNEQGEVIGLAGETDFRRQLGMNMLRQIDDIRAVMEGDLPVLTPEDTLDEALRLMLKEQSSYVLVARSHRPVGILTERDIAGLLVTVKDTRAVLLRDVMHAPVQTVPHKMAVSEVAHLMQARQFRHMVVVDEDGVILGMVTLHKLMERIAALLGHEKSMQQQARAELARRTAEQRLLMAVEATNLGFWELELPSRNLKYSDTLQRVLGLTAAEAPRCLDEWLAQIHPEDRALIMGKFDTLLQSGDEMIEFDYRRVSKAETSIWMHVRGGVVERDEAGQARLVAGTAMDITERKRNEAALIRYKTHLEEEVQLRTRALELALDAAEAANRAKSVFLSNMTHELRTPLNAILGFSSLMHRDKQLKSSYRDNLEIINRSGNQLLTMVNEVLEMARIEAGQIQLKFSPLNLELLVADVIDMMHVRAETKGLQLRLEQVPHMPRCIRGDEVHLRQILISLLDNALKATQHGGVTVRLRMVQPHQLIIEVEDSGSGIMAADSERIFQPFVQMGEAAAQKGAGLGLTIARQFVHMMGGKISFVSIPGKGTTFRVELPLESIEADCVIDEGRPDTCSAMRPQPDDATEPEVLVLTSQMLRESTQRWKDELHAALMNLDSERINALINQSADAKLQRVLHTLADNYDYPAIIKALSANQSAS